MGPFCELVGLGGVDLLKLRFDMCEAGGKLAFDQRVRRHSKPCFYCSLVLYLDRRCADQILELIKVLTVCLLYLQDQQASDSRHHDDINKFSLCPSTSCPQQT